MSAMFGDQAALRQALSEAEAWAEVGYSDESRAYWSGMRDTLRVVLGETTTIPTTTGPGCDNAAATILIARNALLHRTS